MFSMPPSLDIQWKTDYLFEGSGNFINILHNWLFYFCDQQIYNKENQNKSILINKRIPHLKLIDTRKLSNQTRY